MTQQTNALLATGFDRAGRDDVVRNGFDNAPTAAPVAPATATQRSPMLERITQWRNWKLGVKLTAVVLVPMIFAGTLSVLQIADQTRQSNEYAKLDGVVRSAAAVRSVVAELQEERIATTGFLAGVAVSAAPLQQRFAATDRAANVPSLRRRHHARVVHSAEDAANGQLNRLPELRRRILALQVDPVSAISTYTAAIDALLGLDRTLVGQMSSARLSSTATTLHELMHVGEEIRLQQALVLIVLTRGNTASEARSALADSETRRLSSASEFLASATPQQQSDYTHLFSRPEFEARESSVHLILAGHDDPATTATLTRTWNRQSRSTMDGIGALEANLDGQLRNTAFLLQDNASNMAGLEAVILLSALLATGAVVAVVARQLLGSLAALRRAALDTAQVQLPEAVANIRIGHRATVARVPVDTGEEIGQLARAFDAVNIQAINLASEQAQLRRNHRDSFVNVARRSQSLLERQLRLFEHLERDEEDPDQLATLFQLDHLATRMRRNNENLMVLSGADLTRRFTESTTPADLVRAAVSEVEQYPRVIMQPVPDVKVAGYVASDMVRLLAELVDNAANFSAPQTKVVVSGHQRGDGSLCLEIVDRGVGMTRADLHDANQRLSADAGIDLSTSRRLGLFVVGRLASRHGIGVELHRGADDVGVRAVVTLGRELLSEPARPRSATRANGVRQGTTNDTAAERTMPRTDIGWHAAAETAVQPAPSHNGSRMLNGNTAGAEPQHSEQRHAVRGREQNGDAGGLFTPPTVQHDTNVAADPDGETDDCPTPIFDDLASAWFQVSQSPQHAYPSEGERGIRWPARPADMADEPDQSDVDDGTSQQAVSPTQSSAPAPREEERSTPTLDHASDPVPEWRFTADRARHRAEEVSSTEPADFTAAGLPRRTPRARLVAGSAADSAVDSNEPTRPRRDPNVTRGRLSRFQKGLQQGRHSGNAEHRDQPRTGSGRTTDLGIGRRQTSSQLDKPPAPRDDQPTYTAAGLPRRTPRTQRITATSSETPDGGAPVRDADSMRGRLTSFQRGARQGKHSLGAEDDERPDDNR